MVLAVENEPYVVGVITGRVTRIWCETNGPLKVVGCGNGVEFHARWDADECALLISSNGEQGVNSVTIEDRVGNRETLLLIVA